MRSSVFAVTFLLFSCCVMFASDSPNKPEGQRTVQGCLVGSGDSFHLTTDMGTTYELAGDTARLNKLAGKKVRIHGVKGPATDAPTGTHGDSSLATTQSGVGAAPTIQVTGAKKVADSCEAGRGKSR